MTNPDDREDALARLRGAADADAIRLVSHPAPSPSSTTEAPPADAAPTRPVAEAVVVYDERATARPWPLRHPFTIDGVRVASLRFHEPSFADVEACVTGRITEHELHARMAGVEVKVLRALRWSDSEIMTLVARTIAPELRSR